MRTTLGLIVAIVLVASGGACAPAPAAPTAAPAKPAPAKEAPAAQPAAKPSGKLTEAVSSMGTEEIWLPWAESGREGWYVLSSVYESLITTNPETGAIVPMLAERWASEDGGKRWRFFLRKGVQFHNNQGEVTAEDVKYSMERFSDKEARASASSMYRAAMEGIEIVNPYEVVFQLKEPNVAFDTQVTLGYFGVASKKYVESVGEKEAASKPVGSGPFRLVDHKRNQSATLEALDQHWRKTPGFKTVVLRQIPDDAARLATLRAGEVDVAGLSFKFKREAEAAGMQMLRIPSAGIYHVYLGGQVQPTRETFDPKVPWVGDPKDPASLERALKVRKALNLAVDKQAIMQSVFEGEGIPMAVPYLVPGSEFVPADLKPYPYDPEQAKRLLAEAGYGQGFSREIEMLLMPWPGRAEMVDVGEAVAGFWERNLGVKVKRTPMDYAVWAPQVGRPRNMAWRTGAHGFLARPMVEPVISMGTWGFSKSSQMTLAETAEIDGLHSKILAEPDRTKRVELYRALAKAMYDGYHTVPITAVPALYAYNSKVLGSWPLPPGDAYAYGFENAVPAAR
jgi:ABC-type transport system substrate-binding protein